MFSNNQLMHCLIEDNGFCTKIPILLILKQKSFTHSFEFRWTVSLIKSKQLHFWVYLSRRRESCQRNCQCIFRHHSLCACALKGRWHSSKWTEIVVPTRVRARNHPVRRISKQKANAKQTHKKEAMFAFSCPCSQNFEKMAPKFRKFGNKPMTFGLNKHYLSSKYNSDLLFHHLKMEEEWKWVDFVSNLRPEVLSRGVKSDRTYKLHMYLRKQN